MWRTILGLIRGFRCRATTLSIGRNRGRGSFSILSPTWANRGEIMWRFGRGELGLLSGDTYEHVSTGSGMKGGGLAVNAAALSWRSGGWGSAS
jgi:hypothetical protein